MQGIVCTLRVPLHAVQLAQRFASKLAHYAITLALLATSTVVRTIFVVRKSYKKQKARDLVGLVLFVYYILRPAFVAEYLNL